MLSSTNDHLTYLEVEINLHSKDSVATLCILRSSPNLKELKIKVSCISGMVIMDFDHYGLKIFNTDDFMALNLSF